MRTLREEALAEGELKARREAELLRQTERLTAIGVKLQSTCSEAEAKVSLKCINCRFEPIFSFNPLFNF